MIEEHYTPKQLAAKFGGSVDTWRRRAARIGGIKDGIWHVPESAIRKWMEANRSTPPTSRHEALNEITERFDL